MVELMFNKYFSPLPRSRAPALPQSACIDRRARAHVRRQHSARSGGVIAGDGITCSAATKVSTAASEQVHPDARATRRCGGAKRAFLSGTLRREFGKVKGMLKKGKLTTSDLDIIAARCACAPRAARRAPCAAC